MKLEILCFPKTPGIVRYRSEEEGLDAYFNRYHGKIQFPKVFHERFGFKKGVGIILLEHPGDPLNKFFIAIANESELSQAYTLHDWGGKNGNAGRTGISAPQFFETMGIPEGEKTKLLKSTQYQQYGEQGFYITLKPYMHDERFIFEGDVTLAIPVKK